MDPHAVAGRKRIHNGDPTDDSYEIQTLIGDYWAEDGSHNDSTSTRHLQQRRRLYREFPPIPPAVSVWAPDIPNCPELYRSPLACSQVQTKRAPADSSELSHVGSSLEDIHGAHIFALQSQKSPAQAGNLVFDQMRYHPRTTPGYSANSGSTNSRTLRGSYGIPTAATREASMELMLDAPDDLSYTFPSDGVGEYLLNQEVHDLRVYSEQPLTHGQGVQYSGMLSRQEIDPPWSHVHASHNYTAVLAQRPRTTWPEEVLDGTSDDFLVQQMNSAAAYPSHISSPLSNASWHPREMMTLVTSPLQLSDSSSAYAQEPLPGGNVTFQENQDLSGTQAEDGPERESNLLLPLSYNFQNSISDMSWTSVDISRSFGSTPENFTLTGWPTTLTEPLSNNVLQTANNNAPYLQPTSLGPSGLSQPISEEMALKTSKDRKWEHAIVSNGSFRQLGNQTASKNSNKKTGRRKGPLDVDVARKAGEVRHNRACWRCWNLHISCSVGQPCDNCQNLQSFRICTKVHLDEYTELFFPELVVARRHPSAVQKMADMNVAAFTKNKIQVNVSSGSNSTPMTLPVYEFVPKNTNFLFLYWAPPDINSATRNSERVYAPPLGLLNKEEGKLRDNCRDHIKHLIKNSQYCKDATCGDKFPMLWEIYEAISCYRKSKPVQGNTDLIRKALKLHVIHFFMSRIIDFTPDCAKKVAANLRSPAQFPYGHSVSSKLLIHQIKREMNIIQHELTSEVLGELQIELRRKDKTLWGTCFCVVLTLSMCIEAVQISVDGSIAGASPSPISRDDGFEISRHIEERLFKDCMTFFHMVYRSGEPRTGNSKGEFNPIRDGIETSRSQDIDVHTVQLVNEIRRIMRDYHDELEERAQNPSWDNSGDILADHYRFRRENPGRLVARFLRSFAEAA